jgi:hypothetical protein
MSGDIVGRTLVHSSVRDNKKAHVCVCEGPFPVATRKATARNKRPAGLPGYGCSTQLRHVRCLPCAVHQRP